MSIGDPSKSHKGGSWVFIKKRKFLFDVSRLSLSSEQMWPDEYILVQLTSSSRQVNQKLGAKFSLISTFELDFAANRCQLKRRSCR